LGHDRVRLAEQGLGDDRGLLAVQPRLDRRPEPRAARADDHHVVGVAVGFGRYLLAARPCVAVNLCVAHNHCPFGQLKILGSAKAPLATSMMYRSVSINVPSVIQANCRCRAFSHETFVQAQYLTGWEEKFFSRPAVMCRHEWQPSV